MKKILFVIVALITLAISVGSCDESINSNPRTFKVKITKKWQDLGIDDWGDERCTVTKYHFKYEFCIAEDSTHAGTDWMTAVEEVKGDTYHLHDEGKTYLIKEGTVNDWRFGLSKNYTTHQFFNNRNR